GAALLNLRLAFAHFSYAVRVYDFPDPKDPALLARVSIVGHATANADESLLFDQITQRHTSRGLFDDRPVPLEVLAALKAEVAAEQAWLHVTTDDATKRALAALIARADREQMADKRFRRELVTWLRANTSSRP